MWLNMYVLYACCYYNSLSYLCDAFTFYQIPHDAIFVFILFHICLQHTSFKILFLLRLLFYYTKFILMSFCTQTVFNILLNKSLAQILISCPALNEYKTFYLMLSNEYEEPKINVFRVHQTKRKLVRCQSIDVTFCVMRM